MSRVVSAVLYRLGVVRALQSLWRQDQDKLDERTTGRARKLVDLAGEEWRERVRLQVRRERDQALKALRGEFEQLSKRCSRLEQLARDLETTIIRTRAQRGLLTRFREAMVSGEIRDHLARAIASATFTDDPAPLLIIDGLFPPDIYDIVLASIPPRSAFSAGDRTKSNFRVHRPTSVIPDLTEEVWTYVEDALIPEVVVPSLVGRFSPFIRPYYEQLFGAAAGAAAAALPLEATAGRLMRRTRGYHLDPHLDPKRVLLTCLLYLARRGDPETYGTSFYRIDGQLVRDHASTYYPGQAGHTCELARIVPFRPNTAAVFLNSAAHGADIPASAPPKTERYAYQVYIGPTGEALRTIVQMLPEGARAAWGESGSD